MLALLILFVLGGLGVGLAALWVFTILPRSLPPVTALENFEPVQGSKIFDDSDELITEFHVERRIFVPLAQIPQALKEAIIATEDARFYSHFGVDPMGIARAVYQNFRHGRIVEGGSTITQQLAKVLFLTPDKSLDRKLKEAVLAVELERRYPKDRLLEMYLNQIYFGHGAFGVEAASRTFFGKSVKDLSIAESALLAGLPKAPSTYSPFEHPEAAKRRRATVLARMVDVNVLKDAESKKLQSFSAHLQELENVLPIDPKYRNPQLGSLAPIRVVNVVFTAGDGNRGVQTAAFNLPNDERVVKEKGTKRVMLKNMQDAKFNRVLVPISKVALRAADQKNLSFEAFFTHILMHELMHGLGPHNIAPGGRATTVRQELKETYSAIEEAKADISGLWALRELADRKLIDPSITKTMYTTFLASAFRSIRFGINEAHGRGIAVQMNYLLDAGAFTVQPGGTFAVDDAKIADAVTALTRDIMTLEAEGSYTKAKELLDRLGVVRPQVQRVLDRLTTVPVDIEPNFTSAVSQ